MVEHGAAADVLRTPAMPYTKGLLESMPAAGATRLATIGGFPPDLGNLPQGCAFAPRCAFRYDRCVQEPPLLAAPAPGHSAACWLVDEGVRLSAPQAEVR